jgi:hypothetical protein
MTRSVKITLIVILAAVGVCLLICGGVATWLYVSLRDDFAPPQGIRVAVGSPDQVNAGDTFIIELRVANDAAEPQIIQSIDVYDSYLAGVLLKSSDPPWSSSSHIMDFVTYDYDLEIPPGGQQVVKFEASAIQAGDFQGDFDVCINSDTSFITEVVRTIVNDAAAAN